MRLTQVSQDTRAQRLKMVPSVLSRETLKAEKPQVNTSFDSLIEPKLPGNLTSRTTKPLVIQEVSESENITPKQESRASR